MYRRLVQRDGIQQTDPSRSNIRYPTKLEQHHVQEAFDEQSFSCALPLNFAPYEELLPKGIHIHPQEDSEMKKEVSQEKDKTVRRRKKERRLIYEQRKAKRTWWDAIDTSSRESLPSWISEGDIF